MYIKPSKRKELIKHTVVYILMAAAVFVIVSLITLFMLGFRFDLDKGNLEQYAFLQFSSSPSGATVTIDGGVVGSKTPSKSSVPAGKHEVVMWRDGYETWNKSVDVKAGTLTWLNYTLLVPKKLAVEPVANYDSLYMTLATSKGNDLIVQKRADTPTFELVDLSSDKIKSTILTIPTNLYSEAAAPGVTHTFKIEKWDDSERHVLVSHSYGEKNEWLILDTQNVSLTKNITKIFDLAFSNVGFSGTSGDILYALDSNDIRRLDLVAGTVSRPLVGNVTAFEIYNESKVITYVGSGKAGANERVAGIYREGDDYPSVIRTTIASQDVPLHISTAHYFNEDYVAISEGKKVDILSGSYPNTTSDNTNSMKIISTFEAKQNIDKLSFSPTGEFILTQSGAYFASYDLEYQKLVSSTIEGNGSSLSLKWLDSNYLWSDRDGRLTIREFDGANAHNINLVTSGQDATLTNNGRYLYSINQTGAGFQLQRVRMILP